MLGSDIPELVVVVVVCVYHTNGANGVGRK